jgi:hypothetical protein
MIHAQLNDKGLLKGKILLRQFYDAYNLSFKPDVVKTLIDFEPMYYHKNLYINLISDLFHTTHLPLPDDKVIKIMANRYTLVTNYPKIHRLLNDIFFLLNRFLRYFVLLFSAVYKRESRAYILVRLENPLWFRAHIKSYKNRT